MFSDTVIVGNTTTSGTQKNVLRQNVLVVKVSGDKSPRDRSLRGQNVLGYKNVLEMKVSEDNTFPVSSRAPNFLGKIPFCAISKKKPILRIFVNTLMKKSV
jgi:hypothetical protein